MVHALSRGEESGKEEPVETFETLLLFRRAALSPDCSTGSVFSSTSFTLTNDLLNHHIEGDMYPTVHRCFLKQVFIL